MEEDWVHGGDGNTGMETATHRPSHLADGDFSMATSADREVF